MRKSILTAAALAAVLFASCEAERQTYIGPSLIMFSDTLTTVAVQSDDQVLSVDLSATYSCDYDRTVGVEIVQKQSNAVEGRHFSVGSYSVTIPAGKLAATFDFKGLYSNIEPEDSLVFSLRLVSPGNDEIGTGSVTKVRLRKVAPYNFEDFTGYAVVTSEFYDTFEPYGDGQKLVLTEPAEGEENTVILHDVYDEGYDFKLVFDPEDPLEPRVEVAEEGVPVAGVLKYLGAPYGDNMMRIANYPALVSSFDTNDRTAELYTVFYIENVGTVVQSNFLTGIRWITEDEAEDILHNGF